MSQEVNSSSAFRTVMNKLNELNNYVNEKSPATTSQKIVCDVYKVAKPVFLACAAALTVKLCLSVISLSVVFSAGGLTGALLSTKKEDLKNADKSALVILSVAAVALLYFQPLFSIAAAATAGAILYFGKEDKVQALLDKLPSLDDIKAKLQEIKEILTGLRAATPESENAGNTEHVPASDNVHDNDVNNDKDKIPSGSDSDSELNSADDAADQPTRT